MTATLRRVGVWALLPLAALVVLVVRALRPVVLIRLGPLSSDRIGHFAANTELYLCQRDLGMQDTRALDIFYHTRPVCNQQLKRMWDRTLHVSGFVRLPDRLNRRLPGYQRHVIPMPRDRDLQGLMARTREHLSFTAEEEHKGQLGLRDLGIPEGMPHICFVARDSAYLDASLPPPQANGGWGYHSYRDSDIHSYLPCVEELARRGYAAIRMGSIVKDALRTTNLRIIDYATNGKRNEFLDIYLAARCRFFISGGTGIDAIPVAFRHPVAYVNYVPLEYVASWCRDHLTIPRKLWLKRERRVMTFREIIESGAGRYLQSERYDEHGIELVENTPEEITAVVVEMDERLKGTWQDTEEDQELQRRFWSLFKASELHGELVSRIGAQFLRENRELLS